MVTVREGSLQIGLVEDAGGSDPNPRKGKGHRYASSTNFKGVITERETDR